MSVLLILTVALLATPLSAETSAPGAERTPEALEVKTVRTELSRAFEFVKPITPDLEQKLEQLRAAHAAPEQASQRKQAVELFDPLVKDIRALQNGPDAAAPKRTVGAAGPSDDAIATGLAQRVNNVSDRLNITGESRRLKILDLYLSRWLSVRQDITPKQAAKNRQSAFQALKTSMAQQGAAQQRVAALMKILFATASGPGTLGTARSSTPAATAPGTNSMNAVRTPTLIGSVGPQTVKNGTVPDLSPENKATTARKSDCDSSQDGLIKTALSIGSCSRIGTKNVESEKGTKGKICEFMKKENYDPSAAWARALAARNKPGADPGDLNERNAEHYLYAYSLTLKPYGLMDHAPVQCAMAIGWTPFKIITAHFRPTSTPSLDETAWGMKGGCGGRQPDWRKECASGTTSI